MGDGHLIYASDDFKQWHMNLSMIFPNRCLTISERIANIKEWHVSADIIPYLESVKKFLRVWLFLLFRILGAQTLIAKC
jgi:hypothetical protein